MLYQLEGTISTLHAKLPPSIEIAVEPESSTFTAGKALDISILHFFLKERRSSIGSPLYGLEGIKGGAKV